MVHGQNIKEKDTGMEREERAASVDEDEQRKLSRTGHAIHTNGALPIRLVTAFGTLGRHAGELRNSKFNQRTFPYSKRNSGCCENRARFHSANHNAKQCKKRRKTKEILTEAGQAWPPMRGTKVKRIKRVVIFLLHILIRCPFSNAFNRRHKKPRRSTPPGK